MNLVVKKKVVRKKKTQEVFLPLTFIYSSSEASQLESVVLKLGHH